VSYLGNIFSLRGKNALVTGAASGLGRRCAVVLAQAGTRRAGGRQPGRPRRDGCHDWPRGRRPPTSLDQTEKSRQRDGTTGLPSTADIFDECRHGR
jgi:NAD(P)-dependent dehydrogenase (short-subunit alcohol dehydrogenase family)